MFLVIKKTTLKRQPNLPECFILNVKWVLYLLTDLSFLLKELWASLKLLFPNASSPGQLPSPFHRTWFQANIAQFLAS